MRFPVVTGGNLEGRNLILPQDFEGEYNVVTLLFQRSQQLDVMTWRTPLDGLRFTFPSVPVYEMTVFQYQPYWRQMYQDANLRRSLNRQQRATTLSVYVDLGDFNRSLDIPTVSSIYTMLIDRSGDIHWRSQGRCDQTRILSLTKAVRQHASSPVAAVR